MYWRVVFDYGNHRDYLPVRSSRWTADYIANEFRYKAKFNNIKVNIYVEEVTP